ncbi:MAG: thioesterase family protein [Campylobacterales bacterium]
MEPFYRRVYYDNTDAGGRIYHTEYLKFCEQARSEIFFKEGLFFEDGGYVIKRIEADYLGGAKLGDLLKIETEVTKFGNTFVEFTQKIYREEQKIFQLKATAVYLDGNQKISKIPPRHKYLLEKYFTRKGVEF